MFILGNVCFEISEVEGGVKESDTPRIVSELLQNLIVTLKMIP